MPRIHVDTLASAFPGMTVMIGSLAGNVETAVHQALRLSLLADGDLFRIQRSSGAILIASADLDEVSRAYGKAWLESMAVEVGLGFNPDTPLEAYTPPLPVNLARDFEAARAHAVASVDNEYEVVTNAWIEANLIDPAQHEGTGTDLPPRP